MLLFNKTVSARNNIKFAPISVNLKNPTFLACADNDTRQESLLVKLQFFKLIVSHNLINFVMPFRATLFVIQNPATP